ncbi:NAD-dependent epimerase/dehydratase family protein [Bacteroidales bacterium]|nr:NAD-dependent epimerase/dehydratase family protein [Bacteroidales bacterium]
MILVTGGTGLLGAHLLHKIVSEGKSVRAIYRNEAKLQHVLKIFSYHSSQAQILFDKIEWVKCDVLDKYTLSMQFADIDEVYHCAAHVSFNPREKEEILSVNINGTENMVDLSLENRINKFCFVSSIASLGKKDKGEVDEECYLQTLKGKSDYAVSKFRAEMEVWRGIEEGLNAIIVNPSIILGAGDWVSDSSLFFSMVNNGLKFYTKGENGFVDVLDVVNAMILLMDSDIVNERFILNGENISYQKLFGDIAKNINKPTPSLSLSEWLGMLACRIEKVRATLMRSSPRITKDSMQSGFSYAAYSNEKIKHKIGFTFSPIESTIKRIAINFVNTVKLKNRT